MNEEKQIAIQNLERYIKEDIIYNGGRENLSDFDEFCINHCMDIEIALNYIKELEQENTNAKYQYDLGYKACEIEFIKRIRDKIEELKKDLDNPKYDRMDTLIEIKILEKILGE